MHIGHGHFFQNLDGRSDHEVWRAEMALADRAEALGFESIWAVEHHFSDYSMSTDPLQFLTWVAGRTDTVGLGTMVSVLPWHDPVRLAESVSVLDHLSGGRVLLGMGRGLARAEFEGFGADMADSRRVFAERAQALLDAFETGRIGGVSLRPTPMAPLRGRAYASSISPESAGIMARLGAGLLIFLQKPWEQTVADIERYAAIFRECNPTRPEPPAPIVVMFNACRPELYDQIVSYYRSTIRHYAFADPALAEVPGYEYYDNIARTIDRHGEEGFARFLADLQPHGSPDEVIEQTLAMVHRLGAGGLIVVSAYGTIGEDVARANQRLFAEAVMPSLYEERTPR